MSYPALMKKLDMGGPTGGAGMPGAKEGGGFMSVTRGGKEAELRGTKGELLVKGEASVEAGGNWEAMGRGLLKAGREGAGGRAVDTELVPERVRGLDRPIVTAGEETVAATAGGGVGLAGGVVSIPLSSIIF